MRNVFFSILAIFLFAFLQATIVPFNLVLLAVLSLSVLLPPRFGLFWAFLAGMILDLSTGQRLGFSSLIFLALSFLVNLYKSKFKAAHFFYLLPFTLVSTWFYNLLNGEMIFIINGIVTTLLLVLIWPIFRVVIERPEETGLQLPLKM